MKIFISKINSVIIILSFFISISHLKAQQTSLDSIQMLINSIYTIEGFQQRLAAELDFNEDLKTNFENKLFTDLLRDDLKNYALTQYNTSIKRTINEYFSDEEINQLANLMESPNGYLIKKILQLDHTNINLQFKNYISTAITESETNAEYQTDSILFYKEFPIPLQKYMEGEFLIFGADDITMPIIIKRTNNTQTEHYKDKISTLDSKWINNSKYMLTYKEGYRLIQDTLVFNIYAIEEDKIKFIQLFPSGSFNKGVLLPKRQLGHQERIRLYQAHLNDDYFNPTKTPLKQEELKTFITKGGHSFFPINPKLKVEARFTEFKNKEIINFPTSSQVQAKFIKYAKLEFDFNNERHQLTAYLSIEPSKEKGNGMLELFVPFTDLTTNKETYGGGRYLSIKLDPITKEFDLDFNKAYYPYCRYSDGYSCPLPPEENKLNIKIEAGIRD